MATTRERAAGPETTDKPTRSRKPIDPEIDLIGKTLRGLSDLDLRAQRRVADYIESWVGSQERRANGGAEGT